MLKARIVGPKEELGDVHMGLTFYGHHLTRDWSEIDPNAEALRRMRGNRYVELHGDHQATPKPPSTPAPAAAAPEREAKAAPADEAAVKAELDELGVTYKADAALGTLRMMLGKAKKAHAKS